MTFSTTEALETTTIAAAPRADASQCTEEMLVLMVHEAPLNPGSDSMGADVYNVRAAPSPPPPPRARRDDGGCMLKWPCSATMRA